MKKEVLFLFLFFLPFSSAAVDNYNNASSLTVAVTLSSSIEKTQGSIEELTAELLFSPKNYPAQSILSEEFSSSPQAEIRQEEEGILFNWNEDSTQYTYATSSTVFIENSLIQIKEKIPYPSPIDADIQEYTIATEIIDITPEMDALAEELVRGEDDLYKSVFILANWTQQNIAYNLSTLNIQASQKSSYVLEKREGVCDELTNLFISLARSRGIPARFVSGLAYSNLGYTFGPHGWAEVFIDGQWIPVDVTYGTFGWIDPSHIKFKEELGSNTVSVSYTWLGRDVEITAEELDIDAQVLNTGGIAQNYVTLELEILNDKVGPGSFVALQGTVTNPHEFYVPLQLALVKAPGVVGPNSKSILLEPHEEQPIFWILHVPEDILPNYVYTTYVEVLGMYGEHASTEFTYAKGYPIVSQAEAENVLSGLSIQEDKPYLDTVSLECSLNKKQYYSDETAIVQCLLEGEIDDVHVCLKESCIPAEQTIEWTLDLEDYKSQRLMVGAEKDGTARYSYFDLVIITIPNVHIENMQPQQLAFTEETTLKFDLITESPIQDLTLSMQGIGSFSLDTLEGRKTLQTTIKGKDVAQGELIFSFSYTDALGTPYTTEQREALFVTNIPWYYALWQSFLNLF